MKGLAANHPVYPGGPPCNEHCPGEWSQYHEGYADGFERAEREANEEIARLERELQRCEEAPYG